MSAFINQRVREMARHGLRHRKVRQISGRDQQSGVRVKEFCELLLQPFIKFVIAGRHPRSRDVQAELLQPIAQRTHDGRMTRQPEVIAPAEINQLPAVMNYVGAIHLSYRRRKQPRRTFWCGADRFKLLSLRALAHTGVSLHRHIVGLAVTIQLNRTLALTPALSPEERENFANALERSSVIDFFQRGICEFPLLGGERWGEGEPISYRIETA